MSDTPESPVTEEAVEETPEVTDAAESEAPAEDTEETLPEWAREKLTKANNEAAKYRTKAKTAADEARQAATTEFEEQLSTLSTEKASVEADLTSTRLELTKLKVALAAEIPGESAADFAELLKGETEEEIAAHAEQVKKLFGVSAPRSARAVDPSQGMSGSTNVSPEEMFGSFIVGKLSK